MLSFFNHYIDKTSKTLATNKSRLESELLIVDRAHASLRKNGYDATYRINHFIELFKKKDADKDSLTPREWAYLASVIKDRFIISGPLIEVYNAAEAQSYINQCRQSIETLTEDLTHLTTVQHSIQTIISSIHIINNTIAELQKHPLFSMDTLREIFATAEKDYEHLITIYNPDKETQYFHLTDTLLKSDPKKLELTTCLAEFAEHTQTLVCQLKSHLLEQLQKTIDNFELNLEKNKYPDTYQDLLLMNPNTSLAEQLIPLLEYYLKPKYLLFDGKHHKAEIKKLIDSLRLNPHDTETIGIIIQFMTKSKEGKKIKLSGTLMKMMHCIFDHLIKAYPAIIAIDLDKVAKLPITEAQTLGSVAINEFTSPLVNSL
jgi:hypothetical protein